MNEKLSAASLREHDMPANGTISGLGIEDTFVPMRERYLRMLPDTGSGAWLWWHRHSLGALPLDFGPSAATVSREKCFLDFCRLHAASDDTIFAFAQKYGVLGIWPARIDGPRSQTGLDQAMHLVSNREAGKSSDYPYSDDGSYWYGEPLALWRRISSYCNAFLLINIALQSGQSADDDLWRICGMGGTKEAIESQSAADGLPLTDIQAQQGVLTFFISSWGLGVPLTPRIITRRFQRSDRNDALAYQTELTPSAWMSLSGGWNDFDYKKCFMACAWREQMKTRPYLAAIPAQNAASPDDDTLVRQSVLFSHLTLALIRSLTSSMRICDTCKYPTSGFLINDVDGSARRIRDDRKVYCSEECRRRGKYSSNRESRAKKALSRQSANPPQKRGRPRKEPPQ